MLKSSLFSFGEKYLVFQIETGGDKPKIQVENPSKLLEKNIEQVELAGQDNRNVEAEKVAQDATNIVLKSESTLQEMLERSNMHISEDGKKAIWKFTVKDLNGHYVESERSVRLTKNLQAKLQARNKDETLKNYTTDRVKLLIYSKLLKSIERDGSIKNNKHNITAFEASNQFLRDQIAELTRAVAAGPQSQSQNIPGGPTRQDAPPGAEAMVAKKDTEYTIADGKSSIGDNKGTLTYQYPGEKKQKVKFNIHPSVSIYKANFKDNGLEKFVVDADGNAIGYFRFNPETKTFETLPGGQLAKAREEQTKETYKITLENDTIHVKKFKDGVLVDPNTEKGDTEVEQLIEEAARVEFFKDKSLAYITKLPIDSAWHPEKKVISKLPPGEAALERLRRELKNVEYKATTDGELYRRREEPNPGHPKEYNKVTYKKIAGTNDWIAIEKDHSEKVFKAFIAEKSNLSREKLEAALDETYRETDVIVTIGGKDLDEVIEENLPKKTLALTDDEPDEKPIAKDEKPVEEPSEVEKPFQIINGIQVPSLFAGAPTDDNWHDIFDFVDSKAIPQDLFMKYHGRNTQVVVRNNVLYSKETINSQEQFYEFKNGVFATISVVPEQIATAENRETVNPNLPKWLKTLPTNDGQWYQAMDYTKWELFKDQAKIRKLQDDYTKNDGKFAIINGKLRYRIKDKDSYKIFEIQKNGKLIDVTPPAEPIVAVREPVLTVPTEPKTRGPVNPPDAPAEKPTEEFYRNTELPFLTRLKNDGSWQKAVDVVDTTKLITGTDTKNIMYAKDGNLEFRVNAGKIERKYSTINGGTIAQRLNGDNWETYRLDLDEANFTKLVDEQVLLISDTPEKLRENIPHILKDLAKQHKIQLSNITIGGKTIQAFTDIVMARAFPGEKPAEAATPSENPEEYYSSPLLKFLTKLKKNGPWQKSKDVIDPSTDEYKNGWNNFDEYKIEDGKLYGKSEFEDVIYIYDIGDKKATKDNAIKLEIVSKNYLKKAPYERDLKEYLINRAKVNNKAALDTYIKGELKTIQPGGLFDLAKRQSLTVEGKIKTTDDVINDFKASFTGESAPKVAEAPAVAEAPSEEFYKNEKLPWLTKLPKKEDGKWHKAEEVLAEDLPEEHGTSYTFAEFQLWKGKVFGMDNNDGLIEIAKIEEEEIFEWTRREYSTQARYEEDIVFDLRQNLEAGKTLEDYIKESIESEYPIFKTAKTGNLTVDNKKKSVQELIADCKRISASLDKSIAGQPSEPAAEGPGTLASHPADSEEQKTARAKAIKEGTLFMNADEALEKGLLIVTKTDKNKKRTFALTENYTWLDPDPSSVNYAVREKTPQEKAAKPAVAPAQPAVAPAEPTAAAAPSAAPSEEPALQAQIEKLIFDKKSVQEVIDELARIGIQLKDKYKNELEKEIDFTPTGSATKLTWQLNEKGNFGFGSTIDPRFTNSKVNDTGEKIKANGLLDKILGIRSEKQGQQSPEYQPFLQKTRRGLIKTEREKNISNENDKFLEEYKKLSEQVYTVDNRIGSLYEGDIEKQWQQFDGIKPVRDILKVKPFDVFPNQVPRVAAAILTEGYNDRVELEDVFTIINREGGFKGIDPKIIPAELLKDSDDFMKKYTELKGKMENDTSISEERTMFTSMTNDILLPSFRLLDKLQYIKYPEKGQEAAEMSEEEILKAGLAQGQDKALEGLKKIFNYTEDTSNGWEKMMNWIAGGIRADEMTMSRADGTTFALDEGMFRRHFAPQAALLGFLNKPGLYTLENGKKRLDESAVVTELNRILKVGYGQLMIEANLTHKDTTGPKYQEATYKINGLADLANLSEDKMMVFQTGYIVEKTRQFEQKVKDAKEIMKGSPAAIKGILEKLNAAGIPSRQLDKIKSTLLGYGYMQFEDKGDGNGMQPTGGGFGTKIDVGDGYQLLVGVGGTKDNPFVTGVGLNIEVYKGEVSTISIPIGVSLSTAGTGVGVGVAGKHDFGSNGELGWSAGMGVGFSWADLAALPTLGAQVGLSYSWQKAWNDKSVRENTKEAQKSSGISKETWDKWASGEYNTEEKLEILKQDKTALAEIEKAQREHPDAVTEDMFVHSVDLHIEKAKQEGVYDKLRAAGFVGLNVNAGVAALGVATGFGWLLGAEFEIGSATVFIPHPREEARILDEISSLVIDDKLKKELSDRAKKEIAELNAGTGPVKFTETTPNIYYRPGLGLGIRTESTEVSFDALAKTSAGTGTPFDKYNEALKPAEIRLIESGKRAELVIDNDDDKDIEIHIDPALQKLALVKDGGNVILSGNIGDLIITRERFEFNRNLAEGTSIRDVITIRQNESMLAETDRMFIEAHEGKYLEKVIGQKQYQIKTGNNPEGLQSNIIDNTQEDRSGDTGNRLKYHDGFRDEAERGNGLTEERVTKLEADATEMQKALGAKTEAEYNSNTTMDEQALYNALDDVYKSAGFKAQLDRIEVITDPENMIALLKQQSGLENLSDKEYNIAISYMLNRHYSNLNQSPARLNKVKEYTKQKYLSAFVTMKNNLGLKSSAQAMADKFVDDIYNGLAEKLKTASVSGLNPGDIFVSGTWGTNNGSRQRAFGLTANYEQIVKPGNLAHEFGFFGDTGKDYDLNSQDPVEKDLARALLEIASPVKTSNEELIRSPLATKILGLKAYRLMVEDVNNGGGEAQFKAMMEIVKDPTKTSQYAAEMNRFRGFVEEVRKHQMDKTPYVIKTHDGLTITLDMSDTKVHSGAYTKCGNASHSVNELGSIKIEGITAQTAVVGVLDTTNEVQNVELSKRFVNFGFATGFTSSSGTTERKGKDDREGADGETPGDKDAGQGAGQQINAEGQEMDINSGDGTNVGG